MLYDKLGNIKFQFYAKDVHFRYFDDIKDDRYKYLLDTIMYLNSVANKGYVAGTDGFAKLNKYNNVLFFLNSKKDLNYDEKIFILINVCDPKLFVYKSFVSTEFISDMEINECSDDLEKEKLIHEKSLIFDNFTKNIRNEIGFYESKLLKYEKYFYLKYLLPSNTINNDEIDFSKKDLDLTISNFHFNDLFEKAKKYKETFNGNIKSFEKLLKYEPTMLELKNDLEIYVFYILVLDSDLILMNLFEEESNWKVIEKRFKDQFGYYSKNLFNLEKQYVKCNNIPIQSFDGLKK